MLEFLNPTNIQVCLEDSQNVNMNLFPGGLDHQLPFDFCFVKNDMPKLSLDMPLVMSKRMYSLFQSCWENIDNGRLEILKTISNFEEN